MHKELIADQLFFEQLAKDLEDVANEEVTKLGSDGEGLRTRVDEAARKLQQDLGR